MPHECLYSKGDPFAGAGDVENRLVPHGAVGEVFGVLAGGPDDIAELVRHGREHVGVVGLGLAARGFILL